MTNSKEYVAYEGEKFIVEWYFDRKGVSNALVYFEDLTFDEQIKLLGLFKLISDFGEIKNTTKFNYEGDKIYAFKPQPHRFLCFFFKGNKIIVTNAYHKKSAKLPKSEKNKAIRCKYNYEIRVQLREYYD